MQYQSVTHSAERETLRQAGFTPTQIQRLEQLRMQYPLIELVDDHQMERLRFLKWLHDHDQHPGQSTSR